MLVVYSYSPEVVGSEGLSVAGTVTRVSTVAVTVVSMAVTMSLVSSAIATISSVTVAGSGESTNAE